MNEFYLYTKHFLLGNIFCFGGYSKIKKTTNISLLFINEEPIIYAQPGRLSL